MKKQLTKKLRDIAEAMPVVFEKQRIKKSGADILLQDPKAADKEGRPLNPKHYYIDQVAKPVNHYEKLKALAKRTEAGKLDMALSEYMRSAEILNGSQQEKAQANIVSF